MVTESGDRPTLTDEIEITPEMIEAGLSELWNHDITEPRESEMREAVRAVYFAMRTSREQTPLVVQRLR